MVLCLQHYSRSFRAFALLLAQVSLISVSYCQPADDPRYMSSEQQAAMIRSHVQQVMQILSKRLSEAQLKRIYWKEIDGDIRSTEQAKRLVRKLTASSKIDRIAFEQKEEAIYNRLYDKSQKMLRQEFKISDLDLWAIRVRGHEKNWPSLEKPVRPQ